MGAASRGNCRVLRAEDRGGRTGPLGGPCGGEGRSILGNKIRAEGLEFGVSRGPPRYPSSEKPLEVS